MCGWLPRILSRSVSWRPVMPASAMVVAHLVGFEIACRAPFELGLEAAALLHWIVQLAERVRNLHPVNVELEALDGVRVVGALLRQRRDLGRKVVDEGRLDELIFAER